MAATSALERLVLDAGLGAREAAWLAWLLDHVRDWPEGSDGLAGALLRWRRQEALDAYAAGVTDACEHLAALRRAGVEGPGVFTANDLIRTYELNQVPVEDIMQ
jgi:hypothetical protein